MIESAGWVFLGVFYLGDFFTDFDLGILSYFGGFGTLLTGVFFSFNSFFVTSVD